MNLYDVIEGRNDEVSIKRLLPGSGQLDVSLLFCVTSLNKRGKGDGGEGELIG